MGKKRKSRIPGQLAIDAQTRNAGKAAADQTKSDAHKMGVGGGPNSIADICNQIHAFHTRRRYAIKLQQKIDRALESYVRINHTEWSPDMSDEERKPINAQVKTLIEAAREGGGDEMLVNLVNMTDLSREPSDDLRRACEHSMTALARELPVHEWVAGVNGAGTIGLATIIGEAYSIHRPGGLEQYAGPAKLWKRLGFAPYDGLAGSTWKRESWRTRALTKEEWIKNPFSGQRYAPMRTIATWLVNHQWIAAKKTEDGVGKPTGPYGEIYAARRAHTAVTHADWTPAHSHSDALRITMKRFLRDLWNAWQRSMPDRDDRVDAPRPQAPPPPPTKEAADAHP